jgi:hypothetical protein
MKNRNMLMLTLTLLSTSAVAQTPDDFLSAVEDHQRAQVTDKALLKAQVAFGTCLQQTIEDIGGGYKGLREMVSLLEKLSPTAYRPASFFNAATAACEKLADKYPSSRISNEKKLEAVRLNETRMSPKVYGVLLDFLYPEVRCKKVALTLGIAALIAAVDGRVEVAGCTSTTGRQWLELRLGGGTGRDNFGAVGTVGGGRDVRRNVNTRAPFMKQGYGYWAGALLIGGGEGNSNNQGPGDHYLGVNGEATQYYGGLGLGTVGTNGSAVGIRIIPWFDSEKAIGPYRNYFEVPSLSSSQKRGMLSEILFEMRMNSAISSRVTDSIILARRRK